MRKCVVLVGLMVLGNFAGSRAAAQQDGAAEAAIQKLQLQAVASLDNDRAFRQTVRRFRRLLGDRGFEPLDAIRVDVAVESGVPRFSWPGENRFESYSLAQILNGPITEAGSLTLHIRSFLLAGKRSSSQKAKNRSPAERPSASNWPCPPRRAASRCASAHGLIDSGAGNSKPREVVRGRGCGMKFRPGYLYWNTVRLKVRKGLPVTLRVEE